MPFQPLSDTKFTEEEKQQLGEVRTGLIKEEKAVLQEVSDNVATLEALSRIGAFARAVRYNEPAKEAEPTKESLQERLAQASTNESEAKTASLQANTIAEEAEMLANQTIAAALKAHEHAKEALEKARKLSESSQGPILE